MAPSDDAPSFEDQEKQAMKELVAIHPRVRSEIVKGIGLDVWKAMTIFEKLDAVMKKLPEVSDDHTEDWEKDIARNVANSMGEAADEPDDPKEDNDTSVGEEQEQGPRYWVPSGRCPYGLDKGQWIIGEDELRQHNSEHSCWIRIDGEVYDVTDFLRRHPGGAARILEYGGGDASAAFNAVGHSSRALELREEYRIGRFDDPEQNAKQELIAIHPNIRAEAVKDISNDEWRAMSIIQKLEFVKQRMPDIQQDQGDEERLPTKFEDPFKSAESTGRCPYGFDQVDIVEEATVAKSADTDAKAPAAADAKSAVCPISGKAGTCPMQAMQKKQPPVVQSAPAPPKKTQPAKGKGKGEECVIA